MKIRRGWFRATWFSFTALLLILPAGAQIRPTSGGGSPGGRGGGANNNPTITGFPGDASPTNPGLPAGSISRPLFFSGRVVLDDGNPAPLNLVIRRVCSGSPRTVSYTDSKGHFSFQWGDMSGVMPDASEDGGGLAARAALTAPIHSGTRAATLPTMGCDLVAVAAGYQSDRVDLSSQRFLDNGDVGTIVLHRIAGIDGRSISATSLNAPKDAVKAWEKGSQELLKNKSSDAEKNLGKAVELYPKFASAWFDLGRARLLGKNRDGAREAFIRATEADDKLVGPYIELGQLAVQDQKWEDAAKYLDRAMALDPVDYPQLWYINGVANFNARQISAAEHSVREAMKIDSQGKNPAIRQLLGVVLDQKGDKAGALEAYREFVRMAPDGPDAGKTKQRIVQLEASSKTN